MYREAIPACLRYAFALLSSARISPTALLTASQSANVSRPDFTYSVLPLLSFTVREIWIFGSPPLYRWIQTIRALVPSSTEILLATVTSFFGSYAMSSSVET